MTRALVSIGTGPQRRLLPLARQTLRPYARRHGYELHLLSEADSRGRPAPWAKVLLLRRLAERCETLLWFDCDLTVMNGRRDLADALPAGKLLGLVEHRLPTGVMPNTGVLVLRGGDEACRFLEEVWAQEDLVDHQWWENAAICRLLGYELDPPRRVRQTAWFERTAFLDPRWNSIPDARIPRAYVRHYPGYKVRTRAAFMARDLAEAAVRGAAGRW